MVAVLVSGIVLEVVAAIYILREFLKERKCS